MADGNRDDWWRQTRGLAIASLGGAGLIGFLLLVLGPLLAGDSFLGIDLDSLLIVAGLPVVLTAIVVWQVARQGEVDRHHGYFED